MPARMPISEQLTYCTVRVVGKLKNGSLSTGTGFFYRFVDNGDSFVPAIVTNKHVVEGVETGTFVFTEKSEKGEPLHGQNFNIELSNLERIIVEHPDSDVDLCAIPIAPLLKEAQKQGHTFFYLTIDKSLIPTREELSDMTALEDIVMIGYPNGIWDAANNMPVIRRGITATHPNLDYNGKKEFMIDAACFPGSSGSPVFLYNIGGYTSRSEGTVIGPSRVKLLGALYAGPQYTATGEIQVLEIPAAQRAVAFSRIPNNLGIVIKAERLQELDTEFQSK